MILAASYEGNRCSPCSIDKDTGVRPETRKVKVVDVLNPDSALMVLDPVQHLERGWSKRVRSSPWNITGCDPDPAIPPNIFFKKIRILGLTELK